MSSFQTEDPEPSARLPRREISVCDAVVPAERVFVEQDPEVSHAEGNRAQAELGRGTLLSKMNATVWESRR